MNQDLVLRLFSENELGLRSGEPVVIGVPLPRGWTDDSGLCLLDDRGNGVSCDIKVLDRWPDRTPRWALLAFRAQVRGKEAGFSLSRGEEKMNPELDSEAYKLKTRKDDESIVVDTGPVAFHLSSGSSWPIVEVFGADGKPCADCPACGLSVTMADGSRPRCLVREIRIEAAGDIRAVVSGSGAAALPSARRLEIDWQLEFFAGIPAVMVEVTLRNPHRARHAGGYWELGDPGSLLIREVAFALRPSFATEKSEARLSIGPGSKLEPIPIPFELYQDSSGGQNWRSSNHVNREGRIPIAFRGYRRSDGVSPNGYRAAPLMTLETSSGTLCFAPAGFWQNFPKALELNESGIVYSLFPRQWSDVHELQGGEQKTHAFAVAFGADGVKETPLAWYRSRLVPVIDPEWTARTEVVPHFIPESADPHREYVALARSALEGEDTFEKKREVIDEYGWRNFGDIYGDHETVFAKEFTGPGPLVSHYNNQYDALAGFCIQWLRSGEPGWWRHFQELAAHVVDIDIYHTDEDKSAYNHGLFWHTFHYVHAGKSTHRSYPRIGKSNGGGPAGEQNYTTGLMMHYYLTGNLRSYRAAVGLAQFVIDMDDGRRTPFRRLARGNTGLASHSGSVDYHGPGRGSGNSLNALLDGHRLTGDSRFMEKAETLIRRVSHPHQNIAALNLLDSERRWFYTMYLQALGKYLDYKRESGVMDRMFAYAKETLLHFARWMAANEYPFLDKPEILEYPTETWAAQDMRKCEVFQYAARYASGAERERFTERARYFFRRSVNGLAAHKTRTFCRPVVLMLNYGWSHAGFLEREHDPAPDSEIPKEGWPEFKPFIPQKACALRRVKQMIAAAVVIMFVAAAAWLILR